MARAPDPRRAAPQALGAPARLAAGAAALLLAALAAGCAAASRAPAPPGSGPERPMTLVFLKTGPNDGALPKDDTRRLFDGHFANMVRLAEERMLLLAGPFSAPRHDPALRGLFVLDTDDRGQAHVLAETDPPTQAGIFVMEYHDLATDAPLRALLAHELRLEEDARREGRTRSPGEGGRLYVLLTAEDGRRARAALAPLAARGTVLLVGRLDGTRAFAILDATDPADAREKLGPAAERLGAHVLDAWFASGELVKLPSMVDAPAD